MDQPRLSVLTILVILTQIWTSGGEDSEIKILTRPQTFQRAIGSNITLPCSVNNLDGSVVTWSKDGQVISADSFKVLKDSRITVNHVPNRGVSITIQGLKVTDSGSYDCALNLKKHVVNVVHTLQIEVPPEIKSLHPLNGSITIRSGSRVRLECRASGQPPPTIYWSRKHNQPFPWGANTNLTTRVLGEVLEMRNITRAYSGDYMCTADNGVGSRPVREFITLDVLYPPEVYIASPWLHSPEGGRVTLVCRVYSNPVARVLWYRDTMKLIEGERLHMSSVGNTYKLSIADVRTQDYGVYYCRASNLLEREVNGVVQLTGAPSVPKVMGSHRSSHVYSYDLVWQVDSAYLMRQHEAAFWPKRLAHAVVGQPPKAAQSKRIPSHHLAGSDFTYNLKGLSNNTDYYVVIRSQNKFGWSPYSQAFTFQTLNKEKASMKLQNKQDIEVFKGEGPLKSEPVVSSGPLAAPLLPSLLIPSLFASLRLPSLITSPLLLLPLLSSLIIQTASWIL